MGASLQAIKIACPACRMHAESCTGKNIGLGYIWHMQLEK